MRPHALVSQWPRTTHDRGGAELVMRAHRNLRRVLPAVILLVGVTAGCRIDMHIQPYYRPMAKSDFFADKRSARLPVKGTVARGDLHEDSYFYTGNDSQFDSQFRAGGTRRRGPAAMGRRPPSRARPEQRDRNGESSSGSRAAGPERQPGPQIPRGGRRAGARGTDSDGCGIYSTASGGSNAPGRAGYVVQLVRSRATYLPCRSSFQREVWLRGSITS